MKRRSLVNWALAAVLLGTGCGSGFGGLGDARLLGGVPAESIMRVEPILALEPASPEAAAALHQRGDALAVDGAFIYHGASSGLVIYEQQDSGVYFKNALHLPGGITDLALNEGRLAVSCGSHGIFIVNMQNPGNPRVVAHRRFLGAAHRLHWEDDKLVVALGSMGVALLGMDLPEAPQLLGYWPSEGMVRHAVRLGKQIFVAEGRFGVTVLSYSPGEGLAFSSRLSTRGDVRSVLPRSDVLIAAEGAAGVSIMAFGDDNALERVAHLAPGDTARDVSVDEKYAYAALGDRGLVVIDVSDPTAPAIAARFENELPINRVVTADARLYLGNDAGGMLILEEDPDQSGGYRQIHPRTGSQR